MELANKTFAVNLNECNLEFASFIRECGRISEKNPDMLLANEYFVFARVTGKPLDVREFYIGSKFGEGIAVAPLKEGESLTAQLEGPLDIKRYRARFARRYNYSQGELNLLVPEENRIFAVQKLAPEETFIQWANHEYDERKQEILENAKYVLFQNINSPVLPLAAFISGLDILIMGESLTGSTGLYREIGKVVGKEMR